ncbi:MAG TPA: metal-dependent transcriptional regulator [Oligoflexia bacterium]|nr:metal-dependent transcriptional regulator [Oligoflexia bacterium]
MASTTVEDYIKCLFLAEQAKNREGESKEEKSIQITMGEISSIMNVQAGTVTSMMKTLSEAGLVEYEPRQGVSLTGCGRKLALHVLRSHRLIELFLVKILGYDWADVHDEAERLEHVVSERFLEKIDKLLEYPENDPHGDPIPGPDGELKNSNAISASEAAIRSFKPGTRYFISRVLRQDELFLRTLSQEGFVPGTEIRALTSDPARGTVSLYSQSGSALVLNDQLASSIFIEAK